MHSRFCLLGRSSHGALAVGLVSSLLAAGCGGGSYSYYQTVLGGPPFVYLGSSSAAGADTTGEESTYFQTGGRTTVDPCAESNARKFVRISMRNLASDSYIHYFLVLIAYVNGEVYPDGAVCPDDVDLYTSFGYQEIPEGDQQEFGNYCIVGPALVYFHLNGQFRRAGGTGASQLASAIAPAQGTSATYDNFFNSGGASVPVPNAILFHNPGTGEGAALKISQNSVGPCDIVVGDPGISDCEQDAFYYVDDSDLISGSVALGVGSGRRVPSEIQGTGCECTGFENPYQELAPSGAGALDALCNEFLRGGLIQYVFVREDTTPPYPQLLWRVTDQSGTEVHNFDQRGPLP
jgi:hypothetical protein